MNTGGKGSKARPLSVPRKQFEDNWERIFGKLSKKSTGVDKSRRKQNEKVIAE
jgi:hypothetical protein